MNALQTAATVAAMQALYAPRARELADHLPPISHGVCESLDLLAFDPSPARVAQVTMQLQGALGFVRKIGEALARESAE